ncbi:hypothetical protein, partial [Burkholderia pseudomallei]|uniref:hypothetical protein n=1 Tax=Burkholderia pseudomallei TaxID=28450 RepID=UPI001C822288
LFFMTSFSPLEAILSSFNWSENSRAGHKHAGAAEHQASASICLTGTRTIAIGRDRSRPR